MRLGIGSFTFTWAIGVPGYPPLRPMTALDLLDRAAGLGVHLVQVADNLPLHGLAASALDALAARAIELDVAIEVGTRGIDLAHLRRYLGLARRFRSPILRVVVDTADHHPAEAEIEAAIAVLLPDLERAGVCLAIENHDRFPVETLARIMRWADSPLVGICLDTVNSFGALEGLEVVIDTLAPWVVNLHVKDFAVCRADHMMGFTIQGRPAGEGRLDIPRLLDVLRDRPCNAVIELWTPPQETLEATIAKENAWAASSVAYLRQWIAR